MSQQPSGWYDDPSDPDLLRYWDGVTWTTHTAPKKSPTASQSTIGGSDPGQTQAPTTPVPHGSGWHQPPQQDRQQGQPPQVPQYPPSQYQQAPQYHQGQQAWMQAVPTTADGAPLASWGRRFGAWVIDGIILMALGFVVVRVVAPDLLSQLSEALSAAGSGDQARADTLVANLTGDAAKVGLIQFIVFAIYCIAFWTTLAQTPGKMAVGISVRRTDRPGPLDLGTAVRRRLLTVLQIVPLIGGLWWPLLIIDGLWPLWDAKRQTLHDKIAGTQVILGKPPRRHG